MRTAVEDAIAAFGIDKRIPLCIGEGNGDLSHLSFFRDVEDRLLIIDFDRLDPARVDITILSLIPGAVERIAQLAIFIDANDVHNRVRAEEMELIGFKGRSIIKWHPAECNASLLDRRSVREGAVEAQVLQCKGKRARAG